MQPTNDFGCHKVPPPAGRTGDVDGNGDVVDEAPDISTWLLARLRFAIVCSWLGPDDGGAPAVTR